MKKKIFCWHRYFRRKIKYSRYFFLKLLLLNIIEVFFALKVIQLFEGINEKKPNKIMQNERDKNLQILF